MTRMKILHQSDIRKFEYPPELSLEMKIYYFSLQPWIEEALKKIRTPTNKVAFVLAYGYFKITRKFYYPSKYHIEDIKFVAKILSLSMEQVRINLYRRNTYATHKKLILEHLGIRNFDVNISQLLQQEALILISSQLGPKLIFNRLIEFLEREKIEIPSYHALANIIGDAFKSYEKKLLIKVRNGLTEENRKLLDELLDTDEKHYSDRKRNLKVKLYRLTLLKRINQSTKPFKIKENVNNFKILKEFFNKLSQIINSLELSDDALSHYATFVMKSKASQLYKRSQEKRYLYLIAFIVHQYYILQDTLIDIHLQSITKIRNVSSRVQKEKNFEERHKKYKSITELKKSFKTYSMMVTEIKDIIDSNRFAANEKVTLIRETIYENTQVECEINDRLDKLVTEGNDILENKDYYDILEARSIKLQNRVAEIVKTASFNEEASNIKLIKAIHYYKEKENNINKKAPISFLEDEEQQILFNIQGKFRKSLYKALLFIKIADAIKSGSLNLKHSYRYRSIDDYMIPKKVWCENLDKYLTSANLKHLKDCERGLEKLSFDLNKQYHTTNSNANNGSNEFITFEKNGNFKLKTPKLKKNKTISVSELFPLFRYIPLSEILSVVNKHTSYLEAFAHHQIKYRKARPDDKTFFAGIMGYGCNIGIKKIAKVSKNINENELENTVNWFFSLNNLHTANNKVLEFINQLKLPEIFRKGKNYHHTSSDGQKFNVGVDSLNADYSFKYFGKGRGVTVCSFIDDRYFPFYSTVISSSLREAAYVIDGLLHNEIVIKSDIHSTDTHGYMETLFGITYLLGFLFGPRIKNFKHQTLYSFVKKKEYKNLGYKILPGKYVNTKIIEEHWDDILRFVATIKLKKTPASQLFKRLSSYSLQNPLYRAIKAFGQIIKSIFLLRYIDEVSLRQSIMKQLNIVENSNKFSKAIFYGNNQEFIYGTKEEQEIAEACKRLIKNCTVCWNYLYLSQLLVDEKSENRKKEIIDIIKNGSIEVWRHIHFQGQFDFTEELLRDTVGFDADKIFEVEI